MQTLIDPFEINPSYNASAYAPPPSRPPMPTLSVDVDVEYDLAAAIEEREAAARERTSSFPPAPRSSSNLDNVPESWSRVRCWCSED